MYPRAAPLRGGEHLLAHVGGLEHGGVAGFLEDLLDEVAIALERPLDDHRAVVEELSDGALIVELSFAGVAWLVREVLKEAGDAAVLEPADARGAVLAAAEGLLAPAS